ncbi:DEAD/DEAH box helicase [Bacillus sp. FJAT-53060]|uniref:DEAD/DEAH box helicase n=1 Tax=Bacillus TaxID=1386 RepID=UPI001CFA8643|nr:DEAD/DEAH box helicase [Bacillus stratosphericus]
MPLQHFDQYPLSDELKQALKALHFHTPTPVQHETLSVAFSKQDLIVKSQTGSGKTAAYGLPICEMVDWAQNKPQALILVPTRELAIQVKQDLTSLGRFKRIKAVAIYGKASFQTQKVELAQKNHIVCGTPGRILDHLEKGTLSLENLTFFVLDEADEMLNMGFIEQVSAIIQHLPPKRMSILFSATMSTEMKELSEQFLQSPRVIEMREEIPVQKITHTVIETEEEAKFSLLQRTIVIENPDSCIIFCNTQERVNELTMKLDDWDVPCDKIHGGMRQEDRFDVMDEFKNGEFRYLIATDIAARGIDVIDMTHVIHYDLPYEKERYIHRTGRTGRAGKSGKTIAFMTKHTQPFIDELKQQAGIDFETHPYPTKEEAEQHVASFEEKIETPIQKENKQAGVEKDIMKLYFNGGKKKKLRAVDFVGTIAKIEDVAFDDIGIITIHETKTYVDILNGKGPLVIKAMRHTTIKGKQLKVHKARS